MAGNLLELTTDTFDEEVGSSELPLLVDFWAEWCGPCKMVAPVLEQIAVENAGKIRLAKLNVDDAPEVAQRYGIMSIPTLLVFRDGQATKRIVGAKGKGQLLQDLAEYL
jgi:thioredoxin 1